MEITRRQVIVSALTIAGAASVSLSSCAPKNRGWLSLRIGYLPIAAELPLFVALEQGFLEKEGLEFSLVSMTSSNDMVTAGTAGRIDVLSGAATNVVFDAGAVSGKRPQVFAINPYSDRPGFITDYLIVRNKQRFPNLASLKGAKVASNAGSATKLFVRLILEKHGVPWGSYDYLEMLPKDWEPALKAGAIDAVSALEPSATQIMVDGAGESIFPGFYADLMKEVPLSGHWFSADFIALAPPEQRAAVVRAYNDAIEFIRNNSEIAKSYYVKYANVRPNIVNKVGLNPWEKSTDISVAQLQLYANLLALNKAIQSNIDVRSYIYQT